jgi:hypothetical protein
MTEAALRDLDAVERLHGMEWFWKRTLWEIQYQPIAWSVFMLLAVASLALVAYVIVYLTYRRRANEEG